MKLVGVVVGVVAGAVLALACGPKIEMDHRDLAEEYCRDWAEFLEECYSDVPWSEDITQMARDECEADEAWDWTDECGDRFWAVRECALTEIPCEEMPTHSFYDDPYCNEEWRAFADNCSYRDDHGG